MVFGPGYGISEPDFRSFWESLGISYSQFSCQEVETFENLHLHKLDNDYFCSYLMTLFAVLKFVYGME